MFHSRRFCKCSTGDLITWHCTSAPSFPASPEPPPSFPPPPANTGGGVPANPLLPPSLLPPVSTESNCCLQADLPPLSRIASTESFGPRRPRTPWRLRRPFQLMFCHTPPDVSTGHFLVRGLSTTKLFTVIIQRSRRATWRSTRNRPS